MLSPQTQTNLKNAKAYFEEHLAVGDYYIAAGQLAGQWVGAGAEMLGLGGIVAKDDFVALCENLHPQTGARLTVKTRDKRRTDDGGEAADRRVFYDFTFSPPKSVSVAALVGGDERIIAAHRDAVKAALRELESFASTRVRAAGANTDRMTRNITAALFEHETSRALDPHLHTHCIVFNATFDAVENRWKALQNFHMLSAQKFVENVYYHELARTLRGCGYTVKNSARGDFRIAEVAPEICEQFSKRHRQIDEQTRQFLAEHPERIEGNVKAIREHLAHRLRSRKIHDMPPERLRALWRSQLTAGDESSLCATPIHGEPAAVTASAALAWAEEHLFDRKSVVCEHELWRHALEFARGSTLTLEALKSESAARDYIRESDGRLADRAALGREWQIVCMAKEGAGRFGPLAAQSSHATQPLTDEQQHALDQILASRDFVTLFRGGAGTGKSFVLRSVQEAIMENGGTTIVLAPQRQQVLDLQRDGLQQAGTVAELLQKQSLPPKALLIVDEAGQIGGRDMLSLLELARAHRGRVILSGDTRQHGPVAASDALRAIERYSGLRAARLDTIRRQDPERAADERERVRIAQYRAAVKAAAEGDAADSFERLDAMGAIVQRNPETARMEIADAFLDLTSRGETALIVSQTRAEVGTLNEGIRESLRARGILGGKEQIVTALNASDLTGAQKLDPRHYPPDHVLVFNRKVGRIARGATGRMVAVIPSGVIVEAAGKIRLVKARHTDRITICTPHLLSLAAHDRLQLKANASSAEGSKLANGEIVTVAKIKRSGEITLDDGRTLPADYRQFVRGYAVTSYGSQGKTVDHVLLADSASRAATNAQQWYVSISRGRKSVRIFTPDKVALRQHITRPGDRSLALDLAANISNRVTSTPDITTTTSGIATNDSDLANKLAPPATASTASHLASRIRKLFGRHVPRGWSLAQIVLRFFPRIVRPVQPIRTTIKP